MDLGLDGKTALLLASTRGLGFACARALVAEGVQVVINGRDAAQGAHAAAQLGAGAQFIAADVTDSEGRQALLAAVQARLGDPAILVLNGAGPTADSFMATAPDDWVQAFQDMLLPAIGLMRHCIPAMVAAGWGRVISLSSISGEEISLGAARANAMRPALVGALGTLARELGPSGVTVNSILSGPFDTDGMRKVVRQHSGRPDLSEADAVRVYAENGPMRRLGRTEELGALCAFLASEPAGYITGQAIAIDGGRVPMLY